MPDPYAMLGETLMLRYIGDRLLRLIPILLVVSFIAFSLMYLAPGDPALKKLVTQGLTPTDEILMLTRENMGLNKSFVVQYLDWLWNFLKGDLGVSYAKNLPVSQLMWKAMGKTATLAFAALLLSLIIAAPLGICTAVRQNKPIDYVVRFFTFVGNSTPAFLIALLLIYAFCIQYNWFPVLAKGGIKGLALPTVALAIPCAGKFIKQIRAEILEQMSKDYVLGAQARGVRPSIFMTRDVLHNAMLTIITVIGLAVGGLFTGSVVIESIFQWPGVGQLVMSAITARDYPVIQGFVIYIAVIYVLINLLTDITYRFFDPRVKAD